MPKLNLKSKIKISSQVLFREVEGEAVILNPDSGVYYGLDPVGTRIWHLLDRHKVLDKVSQQLAEEFEVPSSRCEKDVLKLAESLQKNGLIECLSA